MIRICVQLTWFHIAVIVGVIPGVPWRSGGLEGIVIVRAELDRRRDIAADVVQVLDGVEPVDGLGRAGGGGALGSAGEKHLKIVHGPQKSNDGRSSEVSIWLRLQQQLL